MQYVIGIDSGGTKYLVKACDMQGKVLGEYIGPPAGHYRFSQIEALSRIDMSITNCLVQFQGVREACAGIVCGTTGVDSAQDQEIVQQLYKQLTGFTCPIHCVNDAEVAQFAVTGGIGAVVISGTGSVAFGRNTAGEQTRSGGWPMCIFGDEGSGTWVAYQALHHMSKVLDRRVKTTPLSEMLNEILELHSEKDLLNLCVSIEQMQWKDPGLTGIVDKAADQGDVYAIAILRQAAQDTFALADSVIQKLQLYLEPTFRVGAWGSAIVKSPFHFLLFKELLKQKYSNVDVRIAKEDAATGACRMALQMADENKLNFAQKELLQPHETKNY